MAVLLALLPLSAAQAANIVVTSSADTLADDGACTLREALGNTSRREQYWNDCAGDNSPSQITFQPGLPPIELVTYLELTRSATLTGPSGGQVIRPVAGMKGQLFQIKPSANADIVLERLTFEGARYDMPASTNIWGDSGGAMSVVTGVTYKIDLVMRELTFRDNRVEIPDSFRRVGGGALYVWAENNSTVRIENSLFQNNRLTDDNDDATEGYGGAILTRSPLTITKTLLVNNLISADLDGTGGAIASIDAGDLTISKSTFDANTTLGPGSAIAALWGPNLLVLDSLFDANGASGQYGGVIYQVGASDKPTYFTLANSMLSGNHATPIMLSSSLHASISGSTIADNQVVDGVSGLDANANGDQDVTIASSTFADNYSSAGGDGIGARTAAISLRGSTFLLEDSSVIGNDTEANAGEGASGIEALGSQVTIRNSVLANTQFGEANLWRRGSTVLNMSHSLLTPPDTSGEINGSNINNVFTAVAAFGLLGDYGCATPIGHLGDRCVSMRPHSSFATPIIDSGSSSNAYDQRGPGFPHNDGNGSDMGAFELQPPLVAFDTASQALTEGNSGTTTFSYTLRRNGDLRGSTLVSWQTFGNGASPADASDFGSPTMPFGSAFFAEDQRDTVINIQVQGDTATESDEGFRVQLTQITDGQPGAANSATGTIINDDATFVIPTLSLNAIQVDQPEGSIGFYSTHRFRVTRSQDTSGFCSFALDLAGAGADPIEANDLFDTTLGIGGTHQMGPGDTTTDIEVHIAADAEFEGDEGFSLTLVNASGCVTSLNTKTAYSTVVNDDSLFSIQSANAVLAEGDAGSTTFSFMINRSGPVDHAATVSWSVNGSGAHPVDAADFDGNALPSGQVSMPPGVIGIPLSINVAGDLTQENDEDFRIQLGNPRSGGSIDPLNDSRIGIIVDDDDPLAGARIFDNGFE